MAVRVSDAHGDDSGLRGRGVSVMLVVAGEVALDRDGELGEVGSFDLEAATAVCTALWTSTA